MTCTIEYHLYSVTQTSPARDAKRARKCEHSKTTFSRGVSFQILVYPLAVTWIYDRIEDRPDQMSEYLNPSFRPINEPLRTAAHAISLYVHVFSFVVKL